MAATKTDYQAAKEAKQKKILIVMSIVLVVLLAWQLPKYLGGGSSAPAAAPATPATTDPAAQPAATGTPTVGGTPAAAPSTDLRSVAGGAKPKAGQAQLASFSLFKAKDPFVQKISDKVATPAKVAPAAKPDKGAAAPGAPGVTPGVPVAKPPAVVYGFATLSINGVEEPVAAKAEFPAAEPMFQVFAIGKGMVKVGIAGGKLAHGKFAVIKLGKSLTFVDNATGARYVVKLLYTGVEPEPTTTFTAPATGATGAAGTTAQATTTAP